MAVIVTFTIPALPPCANARLKANGAASAKAGRPFRTSSEVKAWRSTAGAFARAAMSAGRVPKFTSRVAVAIVYHLGPAHRRDIDSGVKDTLDALTGIVWTDDRLARRMTVDLADGGTGTTEVTVTELVPVAAWLRP